MSYPAIVAAISRELRRRHIDVDQENVPDIGNIVSEMLECQNAMPDFLRFPMRTLTRIFDFWGLLTTGTFFHNLDPARQGEILDTWRHSRFNVCRNFVRFYESLFLLIVFQEGSQ